MLGTFFMPNNMQSFRTELENPVVERDLIELEKKIFAFKNGQIDEERFRSLRLARGIYGQRQPGVQMIRIKLPYGKLTAAQLRRIAQVSDEYSTGKLHITTRQDIQIHHVSLDRTPQLWEELERDDVTLREACGNTVRNITASAFSGIDPKEVFDVRPYAEQLFQHFLRNPVCQEMGRKIKISFSSSEKDDARSFMHDLGFIAKIQNGQRGFKVLVGGGLGSQSRQADVYSKFLLAEEILTHSEAILRVFDRLGERSNRMKARLKFLIKDLGFERFEAEVKNELQALDPPPSTVNLEEFSPVILEKIPENKLGLETDPIYQKWLETHVYQQKQPDYFAVGVKVNLGDFSSQQARSLAAWVERFTGNELTLTTEQNLIVRHVPRPHLPALFEFLQKWNLADLGFEKSNDITSCPGTDTCNLGIANSTTLSSVLQDHLLKHFPQYTERKVVDIKISGCMNSCGQHMIANIGFQGMSINTKDKRVAPAVQVLLGGGNLGDGEGRFADKVIKIPSKRAVQALDLILKTFEKSGQKDFLTFYDKLGSKFFYELLKPLADSENLEENEFIDWGHQDSYEKAIGVGECAGVVIDLVSTLLLEVEEKLDNATETLAAGRYQDSLYHSNNALVGIAKALLISEGKKTNSHQIILDDFEQAFIATMRLVLPFSWSENLTLFKTNKASEDWAKSYLANAFSLFEEAVKWRKNEQQ